MGKDKGFDKMKLMIEEENKRRIEVNEWLNKYRVQMDKRSEKKEELKKQQKDYKKRVYKKNNKWIGVD